MRPHKFAVGDKVVYTNDYGVCWGVKVITALDRGFNAAPTYLHEGIDTPWSPNYEKRYKLADGFDLLAAHYNDLGYLQEKHGWATTQDQRDELLDGDPFEFLDAG